MKAQLSHVFILAVSLAILASPSAAQVRGPASDRHTDEWANPAAVQQMRNVQLVSQVGGATYAVAVQSGYAYIGAGPRLVILNVSGVADPAVAGRTEMLRGVVRDVAAAGGYAYVVDGEGGLHIIDITNPAAPRETGYHDTPGQAVGVTLAGGYAYVSDSSGLRIIDVTDPAAPGDAGFYDTPGHASGLAVTTGPSAEYIHLADGDGGLVILHQLPYPVYMPLALREHP